MKVPSSSKRCEGSLGEAGEIDVVLEVTAILGPRERSLQVVARVCSSAGITTWSNAETVVQVSPAMPATAVQWHQSRRTGAGQTVEALTTVSLVSVPSTIESSVMVASGEDLGTGWQHAALAEVEVRLRRAGHVVGPVRL